MWSLQASGHHGSRCKDKSTVFNQDDQSLSNSLAMPGHKRGYTLSRGIMTVLLRQCEVSSHV